MSQPLSPPPQTRIALADFDPRYVAGDWNKDSALEQVKQHVDALRDLAYRLYAENQRAVLVVLQGMDTAGKDGAIRRLLTGINPLSCQIASFKAPSADELDHDFLWRIHNATPRRGMIGIFNRSHYEDVLVVRVRKLAPEKEWRSRYQRINEFEELLVEGGITLVKCFLHISKEEQRERLQARLDDPNKRWKFNLGDLAERKFWDDYQAAYEEVLSRCNTDHAPWHIIPADRKWNRDLVISTLVRDTLERLDPKFPPADPALDGVTVE